MIKTTFYITEKQNKAFEKLATKTGLTASEHKRRALDEYLKKEEKR